MIQLSSAYTSSKNYPSIYAKENLSVINENKKTDGLGMSEQSTLAQRIKHNILKNLQINKKRCYN